MVALTIGMATYKDFDGVYFTIQALRLYQDLADTELVVVDNFGDDHTREFVEGWAKGRYVLAKDAVGTAAAKNVVFQAATGDAVLCCDSHVHFYPGVIARLKAYYRDHPGTRDLLQGPLVYDDLTNISTHFAPEWRGQMWGTWATDERGQDPEGEPFDIPMQGMGVFSCWRTSWPGFNPQFRGFGGEEGYIHEKVRQRGGRTLCAPWLRWVHRFGRPAGAPYPLFVEDKLRNYVLGFTELGLDLTPVTDHFKESLPVETVERIVAEVRSATSGAVITPGFTPVDVFTDAALGNPAQPGQPGQSGMVNAIAPIGPVAAERLAVSAMRDLKHHRAIVCFVENNRTLVQQFLALRESWRSVETTDTDLVVMGPGEVLTHLPDDLVKIEQRPAVDDPVWRGYRYINSIACLNGEGAERLDRYTHLLHADVDTFITPAWNAFYPEEFTCGKGAYVNDDDTRQRIRQIAANYGLNYRGIENVTSTWYGPTEVVRRVAGLAETLTKHILTHHFADSEGAWPGWFRGVASMYAGEIAVNHLAPNAQRTDMLDASSTSGESTARYAGVHCWHTDEKFSKFWFAGGRYGAEDFANLDIGIVRDYCMEMSVRSAETLANIPFWDIGGAQVSAAETKPVFTRIHDGNLWQAESVSGPGSTIGQTVVVREGLQALFRDLDIRVLVDAACGDANWISLITEDLDLYLGFDIVDGLIAQNLARHPRTNHFFRAADMVRDVLPKGDAILCRDALVHLPFEMALSAIDNFKRSQSTYVIATTFPTEPENTNPGLGGWWPLNLTAAPYNFPEPVRYLPEHPNPNPDDRFSSKSLGVWRLADL